MADRLSSRAGETCPYLVPVMADHMWIYPAGTYCRPPGQGLRVPAPTTVERVCTRPAYRRCPGFRSAKGAGPLG